MRREPSIHIKKEHLVLVLKKVLGKGDIEALANNIVIQSKQYSLSNRAVVNNTAKLWKSTNKILMSSRDDAGIFAQLLLMIRRKRKHQGIKLIKVGTSEWNMVKEVTSLALEFCNDFELKREEGFKKYIEMTLDRMTKFSMSRFNSYHQSVCEDYAAMQTIQQDMTKNRTNEARDIYEKNLYEKTGVVEDYSKNPSKFVFFVKANQEAARLRVSIKDYIKAQFKGLEWCNSYPEPNQLVGDNAITRLNKYLIENGINPGKEREEEKTVETVQWLKDKLAKNKKKKR